MNRFSFFSKVILVTLLLCFWHFALVGQEVSKCQWMENLENSQEIEQQLSVVQENLDNCGLIIVNGHPVSSDTSSFYIGDTKLFISSIKKKEIRSIETLKGNSAKKLYGTAGLRGVVIITFKRNSTMAKIQRRVVKQLNKNSRT